MRLGKLAPINSWFGFLIFWLGIALIYGSFLMTQYDVLTTSSFLVQSTGGTIKVITDNVFLPQIDVVAGGATGLGIALTISWIFIGLTLAFWLTDSSQLGSFEQTAKSYMIVVIACGFLTSVYWIAGGDQIIDLFVADWAKETWRVLIAVVEGGLFMTVGNQFLFAFAAEMVRSQKDEGLAIFPMAWNGLTRRMHGLKGIKGSNSGAQFPPERQWQPAAEPLRHQGPPARVLDDNRKLPGPARGPQSPQIIGNGGFKMIRPEEVERYT